MHHSVLHSHIALHRFFLKGFFINILTQEKLLLLKRKNMHEK